MYNKKTKSGKNNKRRRRTFLTKEQTLFFQLDEYKIGNFTTGQKKELLKVASLPCVCFVILYYWMRSGRCTFIEIRLNWILTNYNRMSFLCLNSFNFVLVSFQKKKKIEFEKLC